MSLDEEKPIQQPRGPPEHLLARKYERLKEDAPNPDNVINIFTRKGGGGGKNR
ncbi:hypothetical protein ACPU7S_002140 [Salmonella enterica subsp. enterica serovar Manhattan]